MDSSASDPLRNGAIFKLLAHRGSTAAGSAGGSAGKAAAAAPAPGASMMTNRSPVSANGINNLSNSSGSSSSVGTAQASDAGAPPALASTSSPAAPHGFDPIYMARVKSRFNELYRATPIPASILYTDARSALSSAVSGMMSPPAIARPNFASPIHTSAVTSAASPEFMAAVASPSSAQPPTVAVSPLGSSAVGGASGSGSSAHNNAGSVDATATAGNSADPAALHPAAAGGFQIPLKILPPSESVKRSALTESFRAADSTSPSLHIGSRIQSHRSPIASSGSASRRIQPVLLSSSSCSSSGVPRDVGRLTPRQQAPSAAPAPVPPPSRQRSYAGAMDQGSEELRTIEKMRRQPRNDRMSNRVFESYADEVPNDSLRRGDRTKRAVERNISEKFDEESNMSYIESNHRGNARSLNGMDRAAKRARESAAEADDTPSSSRSKRESRGPPTATRDHVRDHNNQDPAPSIGSRRSNAQVNSLLFLMTEKSDDMSAKTPDGSRNKHGAIVSDRVVASKAQTSPPASEEPDVARRPRGRPRKTAIGDAAPSTKREIIKEAEAGRTKNKAPSRDAVDTVAVNMAESKVKFDSEIWSQEEVKVLRKVHMSVPLELHDFWGEISSRYNRSMFDLYGSKAPLRSARECQEIWFEMLNKNASRPRADIQKTKATDRVPHLDQPRKRMTQARMKEIASLASVSRPDDLFDVLPEEASSEGVSQLSRHDGISHRYYRGGGEPSLDSSTPVARSRRRDSIRTPQEEPAARDSSADESSPSALAEINRIQDDVDRFIYKAKSSQEADAGNADWAPSYARNLAKKARHAVEHSDRPAKRKLKRIPTALVSEESFRTETDVAVEQALRDRVMGSQQGGSALVPRGRVRAEVDLVSGRVRMVVDGDEESDPGFVAIVDNNGSSEFDDSDD